MAAANANISLKEKLLAMSEESEAAVYQKHDLLDHTWSSLEEDGLQKLVPAPTTLVKVKWVVSVAHCQSCAAASA